MFSIGSPRNSSPPCCSSASSPRWIAPIDAAEMLPYDVCRLGALSAAYCSSARRSLRSSSSRPLSSATLNTSVSTPCCVSFRFRIRDSSSGPRSLTVARTRMSLLAENVPEHDRHRGKRRRRHADHVEMRHELRRRGARLAHAGEVALDVGHEYRHADAGQAFGDDLQRHGLAGSGCTGDQSVPVGERGQEVEFGVAVPGDRQWIGHRGSP